LNKLQKEQKLLIFVTKIWFLQIVPDLP
jgi:hypothetical protein